MEYKSWVFIFLIGVLKFCLATELTFELSDSAKECFYEEIKKNTSCTLEFQVLKISDNYLVFFTSLYLLFFVRLLQVDNMM